MNAADKSQPLRVLLVDDSPLIRLGLRSALEDCGDIEIVGEAGTAADGLLAAGRLKPDVILLDLHLPDKSGLVACRELKMARAQTQVLILTSSTNERNLQEAMNAGAQGYLLKDVGSEALAAALRAVASGKSVLDPAMADQAFNLVKHRHEPRPADKLNLLSPQERKLVAYLAEGLTNKEIGDRLQLTEKTVKNYLSTIFSKLEISRRSQAAALFAKAGGSTDVA